MRLLRRSPVTLLLLAACLLPVGIGTAMSTHGAAVAALRGELVNEARDQTGVLDDYFRRAQAVDLITAHNPAFRSFYATPGGLDAKIRRGGSLMDEVNGGLAYLEQLYPGAIGEACFIDRHGPEVARMVRGKRARIADLSADESGNPSSSRPSGSTSARSTRRLRTSRPIPASG
jgi:hypothetical protein